MPNVFVAIFVTWGLGVAGYVGFNKSKIYKTRHYYDLTDRLINYKRIKERTNINRK